MSVMRNRLHIIFFATYKLDDIKLGSNKEHTCLNMIIVYLFSLYIVLLSLPPLSKNIFRLFNIDPWKSWLDQYEIE